MIGGAGIEDAVTVSKYKVKTAGIIVGDVGHLAVGDDGTFNVGFRILAGGDAERNDGNGKQVFHLVKLTKK